jgi:hypothetical protein
MSTHFEQRLYPTVDAADKESCRPDFDVAIYPGHLSLAANCFELNPDIRRDDFGVGVTPHRHIPNI